MRKVLASLVAMMLLAGVAFAQETVVVVDEAGGQYAGVSVGYPQYLTGYYGLEDMVAPGADLRFRVGTTFFSFGAGADVLFDVVQVEDQPITLYAGGGLGADLIFVGGFDINVTGVFGGKYAINPDMSVFTEAGLGIGYYSFGGIVSGIGPAFRGALGVNFAF